MAGDDDGVKQDIKPITKNTGNGNNVYQLQAEQIQQQCGLCVAVLSAHSPRRTRCLSRH